MFSPATTVSFEKSSYSVNERGGSVQPVLLLSNPLLSNTTIQVIAGEY